MRTRLFTPPVLLALLALLTWPAAAGAPKVYPASPGTAPSGASLMFIENVGQFAPAARFQARVGDGVLWVADDALWLTVWGQRTGSREPPEPHAPAKARGHEGRRGAGLGREATAETPRRGVNLKLSFVGANQHPSLAPEDRLATRVSYFMGNDPARWRGDVPVWSRVRYRDLYPGIDLEIGGTAGGWELRLHVQPGANLGAVRLRVEGPAGMALDRDAGVVHLQTAVGEYRLPLLGLGTAGRAPDHPSLSGQEIEAPFAAPRGKPEIAQVRPHAGTSDLVFSTLLGGSDWELAGRLAVDATGASYITAYTLSSDFPTTPGAFDPTYGGGYSDALVAKLGPDGTNLVYATYLGGLYGDYGWDIAADTAGAAYLVGYTESPDFPTTPGTFNRVLDPGGSVFVTKLNVDGSVLVYSTFISWGCETGGLQRSCRIAVDPEGNAYVAGITRAWDWPVTPGAFQTVCVGCPDQPDAFVTKLDPTGSALVYSTYLGGWLKDIGMGIALDESGAAYVTGSTLSGDFPTTPGAFRTYNSGGQERGDAFVSKLNPAGTALEYSTFLGGSGDECQDNSCSIAIDTVGAAYVTGNTQSPNFPVTPGVFDPTFQGGEAFVTKLNSDGSSLVYSTYVGGAEGDTGRAVGIGPAGEAFVTGWTVSPDFPTTPDAYDPNWHSTTAAFVTRLNPTGSALEYSTYLGGSDWSIGEDLALDQAGAVRIAGGTNSMDFPTTPGAYSRVLAGGDDLFLVKIAMHMQLRVYLPVVVRIEEP